MNHYLILATDDGVAICQREARTWRVLSQVLHGQKITSVATLTSAILVGTLDGIRRSDDLGNNWQHATGLETQHLRHLSIHPDRFGYIFAGTEPAEIFISTDGGQSWRACPEVAQYRDVNRWYLPYSPEAGCVRGFAVHGQRAYAAVEVGGVLRSDDYGETWQLVNPTAQEGTNNHTTGTVDRDVHDLVVHPISPDLVYAPTGGGLYRSIDGGISWECIQNGYCRSIWLDPNDPDHLILGTATGVDRNGNIEMTQDGGLTWLPESIDQRTPWPRHMVERFSTNGDTILAVLSSGELLEKSPAMRHVWRPVLSEIGKIKAAAVMEV